jgi:hypothetical protein
MASNSKLALANVVPLSPHGQSVPSGRRTSMTTVITPESDAWNVAVNAAHGSPLDSTLLGSLNENPDYRRVGWVRKTFTRLSPSEFTGPDDTGREGRG